MRLMSILFPMVLIGCGLDQLVEESETTLDNEVLNVGGLEASSASIDFGSVSTGNTEYYDLVLTNTSDSPLTIAEALVEGDSAFVIDTITSLPAQLDPDFSEIVTLAFTPTDDGDYIGTFSIDLSDSVDSLVIALSGTGGDEVTEPTSDSSIGLNPVSISFGEIETYETSMELVTVTNDSEDDVLIRNITSDDSYFSYSGDLVPPTVMSAGSSKSFYVEFYPLTEGSFSTTITVETDINDGTDFTLTATGSAVEPDCEVCTPELRVNTPSGDENVMNFLSVYNFPDEQILSIQNLSDVELDISDMYLSNDSQGGDFSVNFSPVVLGPWETTAATVSFVCPELCFEYPNAFSDTNILHIISNDPGESDYQIELWTGF